MFLPFKILRVRGHSMEPTLKAGSFVLVRTGPNGQLKPGDIVVFRDHEARLGSGRAGELEGNAAARETGQAGRLSIKRISKIESDGYILLGDNPADSYDSRDFGSVQREDIIGKVVWR